MPHKQAKASDLEEVLPLTLPVTSLVETQFLCLQRGGHCLCLCHKAGMQVLDELS